MDNNGFESNQKFSKSLKSNVTCLKFKANADSIQLRHDSNIFDVQLNSHKTPSKNSDHSEKYWNDFNKSQKFSYVFYSVLKFIFFAIFLYIFLLSLNFMTIGFTLISPYALRIGNLIKFLLSNPFASLAIGILSTAIIQNATATTSIAVTMVGAGIIPSVKSAIPIIMGSNIGTCVTNSFIALTFSEDRIKFKRAFSAATLNDIFNFLTTLILLSSEILFDFMFILSDKLTSLIPFDHPVLLKNANFIALILNPMCDLFIKIDTNAINAVNEGSNTTKIALRCCQNSNSMNSNQTKISIKNFNSSLAASNNTTYQKLNNLDMLNDELCQECRYWCMPMLKSFGDGGTGLFWIILSLITLILSLFGIVKVLSMLISGPIAHGVRIAINASFPGKLKWFTQFVLFLMALILTLIVQSSNIITATLVPLCGIGIVSLQRVYVMTLGSNIGTTLTGILSAFTLPASSMRKAMQLAFVYTLFNSFGVLFWLPVPFLRFPKVLARKLGNLVFKYKWFLYFYVLFVYFIGPIILLCLALIPHWIGLAIFGIPILCFLFICIILIILKKARPKILPEFFKNFEWLPEWMRSLAYYDKKIRKLKSLFFKKRPMVSRQNIDLDDNSNFIPNFIRRLSVIDSIVHEAMIYSKRNTSVCSHESSEDEIHSESVDERKNRVKENIINGDTTIYKF
ncbi:Sodium-dependent phosphate transport 2B [Brachionus plicatilis]|uniref:Sodium-dependent phosphate transport 2B n=1 Tax=Brachionus plicatilis TaxID=10195 RepID=A0A3M7SLB1_BRAPC|nr:Sodium-dependent phosphate transport 2B [Brachionus plicatilis]